MNAPTTDRGGIQQTIRALVADGWALSHVYDSEENVRVSNELQAIEAIEATGYAILHVRKGDAKGWVQFVLGNAPDEVICDYSTNLTAVDALTESWLCSPGDRYQFGCTDETCYGHDVAAGGAA
jgi:hypothetical protein